MSARGGIEVLLLCVQMQHSVGAEEGTVFNVWAPVLPQFYT